MGLAREEYGLGRSVPGMAQYQPLVASYIVKAVTLSRGYDIQIDLNISEAQYLNGMEMQ